MPILTRFRQDQNFFMNVEIGIKANYGFVKSNEYFRSYGFQ